MRGSVPLYPGYRRAPRNDRLALDDGEGLRVYDGAGRDSRSSGGFLADRDPDRLPVSQIGQWSGLPSATYAEWLESALANKLDVRCDGILGWRYFREAIADKRARVNAAATRSDLHARPVSITWRDGNRWCSLFAATSWSDGASETAVETHQQACDYLGVGVYASPSALGQATMRNQLDKGYTTPARVVRDALLDNLIGGRAELDEPGFWEIAYEQDRRMAYVAECEQELPVGAAEGFETLTDVEQANAYPFWYAECHVTITRPLKRGPFPIRQSAGHVAFPTAPGQYVAWLWRGEAEDALAAGCAVILRRGWGWTRGAPALATWARWIFDKRANAPSERVAEYVKKAAVAAIGWHAMRPHRLRIVPATADDPRPAVVNAAGFPTNYVVETENDTWPRMLPHWASYIWSQARRTLAKRTLQEAEAGNGIIWTNYDSIITTQPTTLNTSVQLGAWREQALTNLTVTASRTAVADQKRVLPGQHGEQRETAIAYALAVKAAHDRERQENPMEIWRRSRGREAIGLEHMMDWRKPRERRKRHEHRD